MIGVIFSSRQVLLIIIITTERPYSCLRKFNRQIFLLSVRERINKPFDQLAMEITASFDEQWMYAPLRCRCGVDVGGLNGLPNHMLSAHLFKVMAEPRRSWHIGEVDHKIPHVSVLCTASLRLTEPPELLHTGTRSPQWLHSDIFIELK